MLLCAVSGARPPCWPVPSERTTRFLLMQASLACIHHPRLLSAGTYNDSLGVKKQRPRSFRLGRKVKRALLPIEQRRRAALLKGQGCCRNGFACSSGLV